MARSAIAVIIALRLQSQPATCYVFILTAAACKPLGNDETNGFAKIDLLLLPLLQQLDGG